MVLSIGAEAVLLAANDCSVADSKKVLSRVGAMEGVGINEDVGSTEDVGIDEDVREGADSGTKLDSSGVSNELMAVGVGDPVVSEELEVKLAASEVGRICEDTSDVGNSDSVGVSNAAVELLAVGVGEGVPEVKSEGTTSEVDGVGLGETVEASGTEVSDAIVLGVSREVAASLEVGTKAPTVFSELSGAALRISTSDGVSKDVVSEAVGDNVGSGDPVVASLVGSGLPVVASLVGSGLPVVASLVGSGEPVVASLVVGSGEPVVASLVVGSGEPVEVVLLSAAEPKSVSSVDGKSDGAAGGELVVVS